MKVLAHDPKTSFLKLRLESASDLWRLSKLVEVGDRAGAFTHRRDPEVPVDTPGAQRERRPVFLSVRVEQVEFHEFTGHLRFTGTIVEGPFDIGKHHTLDLEQGTVVSLNKPMITGSDWALLDEGKGSQDEPTLIVACLDWGEGAIVRLHGRAMEVVTEITRRGTGKMFYLGKGKRERDDEEYLSGFLATLETEAQRTAGGLVIAGPGFCKEELYQRCTERGRKLNPVLLSSSEAGLPGVHELLKSGKAEKVLKGHLMVEEAKEVEQLVQSLGKEGLGAVGPQEVQRALEMGAVQTLMILDTLLHDKLAGQEVDAARRAGATIVIVRHEGEPGKRLKGLGGIGSTLRYRLRSA